MNFFNPKGTEEKSLGVGKDIYSIIYYIPWYHGKFKISMSNNCEDEFEDSMLKDKIFKKYSKKVSYFHSKKINLRKYVFEFFNISKTNVILYINCVVCLSVT
jgi:hypothetical protein